MQDVRLAIRSLRSTPVVTAVAILSLALGIGSNTAIFSIIYSLLVRPLPIVEPHRLVVVSDARGDRGGFIETWTYALWQELRDRAEPLGGAAASWLDRNQSFGGAPAEPVAILWVSGSYFDTLGVAPLLGRAIGPQDEAQAGGPAPAAVISYALWQRRFGGAADVLGKPLVIERVAFTIVGVAPPQFFGTEVGRTFDVALPIEAERVVRGADTRLSPGKNFGGLTVLLRLKPGQSHDAAVSLLRAMQPQIRAAAMPANDPPAYQREFMKDPFTVVPAANGTSGMRSRYQRPLFVIQVVVAMVLLIACANIANLQLARAIARRHELGVRLALGASRWRLARALLVESTLLSAAGAAIGIELATWSGPLLVAQLSSARNHLYLDLGLDWRLLAFTAAIAMVTTIVFGVAPALRASRVAPLDAIRSQARGATAGPSARLSDGLVVAQVALSIVVVVAAGLFVRTFAKLATAPVGVERDRVLVVTVNTSHMHLDAADRHAFVERLGRQVAAIPGVERAAVSLTTPIGGIGLVDIVHTPDMSPSEALEAFTAGALGRRATYLNFVTPQWFATYGTPFRAGRDFTDFDGRSSPPVVVVNEAFVKKFLPGRDPIGQVVGFDRGRGMPVEKTIVGVVANALYTSVRQIDEAVEYAPLAQLDFPTPPAVDAIISVRASGASPLPLIRPIAATLAPVSPDLAFALRPLSEQIGESFTQERAIALVSGVFAVLALLLAGLGLYGVTAYAVVCRRAEIGIRMALGSTPGAVVRLVASRVGALVAAGTLAGVLISAWSTRYIASLLFGLAPRDVLTYAVTIAALAAAAVIAAWPPARRASRIDPAQVLREG
jgi:predicted permease